MQLNVINSTWLVIVGTAIMLIMLFTVIFFVIIHQRRVAIIKDFGLETALLNFSDKLKHSNGL